MSSSLLFRSFGLRSVFRTHPIVSIALAIVFASVLGRFPTPAEGQSGSDNASAAPVWSPDVEPRTFPGILLPGRTALLKSQYDGVLEKVVALVGDRVGAGQLLCQLVAEQEKVERDRAEALLKKTEADLDRARRLHSKGGTSDEALEKAETEYKLAKADFDLASIRLEEHSVRAPFAGVVAERYVDTGASVEAGDPLIRVTALSPLRLEVLLPETMLPSFKGPTVVQLSTSFPDTTIDVPVDLGVIVVDPSSGMFPLQIEIDNAEGRLVPGVSCAVSVPAVPR